MADEINPYQPPGTDEVAHESDTSVPVVLANSPRTRRMATNQYLLRWHPRRLFFGSLLMIAISTVCIHYSVRLGILPFLATAAGVMTVTSMAYMALVRTTKKRIAAKREAYGLTADQPISLRAEPDSLELEMANGKIHRWGYGDVTLYRTSLGILISPEPLLFFLVPRTQDAQMNDTSRFIRAIHAHLSTT